MNPWHHPCLFVRTRHPEFFHALFYFRRSYVSGEVTNNQLKKGLSGRSETIDLHNLLTPNKITRQFARNDRLQRQLILCAGNHLIMLQRVIYHDRISPLAPYIP